MCEFKQIRCVKIEFVWILNSRNFIFTQCQFQICMDFKFTQFHFHTMSIPNLRGFKFMQSDDVFQILITMSIFNLHGS